ncbi:uncharacterized protein LOC124160255 [Ischnura elegans]|uniref:uncharacterized protein LOC124160255 n=1 Tax=Ischnura elegans TaxID=197161 RepID=UPI001ED87412|nr:uncharacterized protein LOC124160255 [Ischnura elegans]
MEVRTEGSLRCHLVRWETTRGPRIRIPSIPLHPRMPPIREEGVDELGRLCEGEGEDPDGARWLRAIGRLYEGDQPEIPGWLFSRTRTPGSPSLRQFLAPRAGPHPPGPLRTSNARTSATSNATSSSPSSGSSNDSEGQTFAQPRIYPRGFFPP